MEGLLLRAECLQVRRSVGIQCVRVPACLHASAEFLRSAQESLAVSYVQWWPVYM